MKVNSNPVPNGSRANKPDLDWSQVHETVLMLNLAVAQIEGALKSGDESVNTLTDAFTSMASEIETIATTAKQLQESNKKSTISQSCQAVSKQMQTTIIAFQFYDKLSQRLTHLSCSMEALANLVATPESLYNPDAWHGLQEKIKSKYTVESDKAMFDAILHGKSVRSALQASKQASKPNTGTETGTDTNDVELF